MTAMEQKKKWHKTTEHFQKLSKHSSLHFDATALKLRLERLYYLIGKEYVKTRHGKEPTISLSKLLKEVETIETEIHSIKSKINPEKPLH